MGAKEMTVAIGGAHINCQKVGVPSYNGNRVN